MGQEPRNLNDVCKVLRTCPPTVQGYFPSLQKLLDELPWEVCVSYVFYRLELAKHMTLYCGIVKLHRTDAVLTRRLVDAHHMSRGEFKSLFETIFGAPVPATQLAILESAEKTRDRVMHGKRVAVAEMRQAVVDVLRFATDFNAHVAGVAGFKPFGDLRGFKGRAKPLSRQTSRWVLRGMGFGG